MNEKRKFSIIKNLKKRNRFSLIVIYILIKLGFVDYSYKDFLIRSRAYHRLYKKYNKQITYYENNTEQGEKIIWFCWFQGIENAPLIVKKCLDSIQTYRGEYKVVLIDKENFSQYCEIPQYIIEKWNKGIITHAHFSDILRTALLIKNGGIWMDSTVLLTGKVEEYILKQDLFMFSYLSKEESMLFDSWFIVSNKNNPLLMSVLDIHYKYWKKTNYLTDYFQYHLFTTMAYEKFYRDKIKMPIFTSDIPHYLARSFHESFNQEKYDFITKLTVIHKLNYKYSDVTKDSFLEYILR